MIYVIFILLFFFFSSRRRHTRCSRDWSSDVCSSDLGSALRTESPPANLVMQAIKLSGQAPELLQVEGASGYAIPTEQLRTQLALLDMLAPGTQKAARGAITAELARRAAKGNP